MRDESKAEDAAVNASSSDSSLVPHPSSLHRIRLGPPWTVTTTAAGARHARKFGRPRTLDADERVWLVCAHLPSPAEVYVNGERVGVSDTSGPFAADVTSLLAPRNEVAFAVPSGGEPSAVALEVRRA